MPARVTSLRDGAVTGPHSAPLPQVRMTPVPPPRDGRDADDRSADRPAGEPPHKLRLIPLRPVLGDLPVRLTFGRVRRFAPAWALRFLPQWPSELVRRWWIAVAAGTCAAALVVALAHSAAPRAQAIDRVTGSWTAAPARRPLRTVLGVADWLDAVPLSLAGAIAFAAFCWRTRRDRLAVAVTLATVAVVALYASLQLLLAPLHAAAQARAIVTWTPGVRALAATAVGWTIAFVMLRDDVTSWPLVVAGLGWPLVTGALRVVGGGALVSSVIAGWAAGLAVAACAAALWLADRRRGTRLA